MSDLFYPEHPPAALRTARQAIARGMYAASVTEIAGHVATIHLVIAATQEEANRLTAKRRASVLAKGGTIEEANGEYVWRTTDAVVDTSEGIEGSARYTWHEDGERCLHRRWEHRAGNAGRESTPLRTCYRRLS